MAKSKYIKIALFCTIGLMVCSQIIVAQIGPPQIGCIVVDSTGSGAATITWVIPSDTNSTFKYYQINSTTNPKSGYTPGPTISPDSRNSVTIAGIGANAAPVYFSGVTEYLGVSSVNGDTVASIFLSVTNLGGVAALQWNAMHTTNLPGFNGWYKIYREYPQYVWKLLDSTQALKYNDTITLCKPTLTYEIVADNSVLGCQSVSNRVSGQFKDIIAPAIPILDSVSVGPGGNIEIT
ncbi:MAG: hypothetical protein ACLQQ4_02140, partial [Bacteroidia bacterium]